MLLSTRRTLPVRAGFLALAAVLLGAAPAGVIASGDEADSDRPAVWAGYSIPLLDLADQTHRQTMVDREAGQYLGHPSTVLLEDGRTIIAVYPKGHGRGAIVMKRSTDGGLTWSERLPTPDNWATSTQTPTLHRTIDPRDGTKRLIMFSGHYPIRMAHSEDDGRSWTPLAPIGDFGGIVAMGSCARLANGDYVALFHDNGRFIRKGGETTDTFTLYQTFSSDGGLTWSEPESIWSGSDVHLCEPGLIRSPDGTQLAILLRENRRRKNSHVMFSDDGARTWSAPRELPGALTGDRHTGRYAPDGRLFISFRDTTRDSITYGDWVGWVGTYDDIVHGREGQYRVRLMDNHHRWDCAYPGVEVLPDGTIVCTTYGHWTKGEKPYVVCVRLTLDELDALAPGEALKPTVPGDWRLTFHDEFAGTRVDETKWTPRDPWERGRNQELQAYVPEALEVRRGMLRAVAQRKSAEYAGTMRQYVSGMMNGAGKFNQRFGLFEIRCRVPRGRGLWPAFWLLPDEPPGWPPEIDVLEILGHQPQRIYFTHHWRDEQRQRRSDGGRWNGPDFSAGFHTIAAAWSDEAIVWYVDGVERARSTKHIPAGRPMFMLINLAVGGTWPGAPDAQTSFPAAFEVDWVRVWERAEETKDR